jgi:hypothetical protein
MLAIADITCLGLMVWLFRGSKQANIKNTIG